jgi:hypothetical protein
VSLSAREELASCWFVREKIMRLGWTLALCVVAGGLGSGCMVAPVVPPIGIVYTGMTAPLDTDLAATELGSKQGKSQSTTILFLVAWGDASTAAAARSASITKIRHADYEYTNVLGIYQSYTTVIYGD